MTIKHQLLTLIFGLFIAVQTTHAEPSQTLQFEVAPYKNSDVFCENDQRINPGANDFELLDYHLMSSEVGERLVLATIKNTSSGLRILKKDYVVAILGDCSRMFPAELERKFQGKQTLTVQLDFGVLKYPVLKVLME